MDATNADEWLAEEIFRAACDPGALAVFRCASQLVETIAIHIVLVLQGPSVCKSMSGTVSGKPPDFIFCFVGRLLPTVLSQCCAGWLSIDS